MIGSLARVLVRVLGVAHRGFMGAVNRTGIVMVATVLGNLLNVVLNYAFIFGNLGAPALGIAGAAVGTLIAEAIMTLVFIAYGQFAPGLRPYRLLRFAHVRRGTIMDILRVMCPRALFFYRVFFIEVLGYSFEIIFSHNGWGRLVLASVFVTNVVFILGWTIIAVWVLDLGIYGAWSGFALYQVAHAGILFGGFLSGRWQHIEVERRSLCE